MKIILAADHGGYALKEEIKEWLKRQSHRVEDAGSTELIEEDDFVDYGSTAAKEIAGRRVDRGILFCRNGFGMMIAANRYRGVRCGLAFNIEAVTRGRTDDDINCLAIPADYLTLDQTIEMINIFLNTEYKADERFVRRLQKLANI